MNEGLIVPVSCAFNQQGNCNAPTDNNTSSSLNAWRIEISLSDRKKFVKIRPGGGGGHLHEIQTAQ